MNTVCASTAGMLTPKGRERSEPVGNTFVLHLPLHYPEEFWFVCLVFKNKPHDFKCCGQTGREQKLSG